MNKLIVAFAAALVLFTTACENERLKMRNHIQELEGKVVKDSSSFTFDDKVRADLAKEMVTYAEKFPEDKKSEDYLFKAGGLYIGMNKGKEAIDIFDKYLKKYPTGANAAQAMFNIGFVYDTQLHDMQKAKDGYRAFVAKFPTHPLAKSAEVTANQLDSGETEDQMIQRFLKNANDSIAAAEAKK
jgi:outer membrane protein assembly factor BamD (BamD/ComL family)